MKHQIQVREALDWLKIHSTERDRKNLTRFAIDAPNALGVSMANMKVLAKQLRHDHELAAALWDTGVYEARMVASMVDEPAKVTPAQMEQWCRDFDNWGIVDTVCFCLFDRVPHAFKKVHSWSSKRDEFQKRAAFALLWSLALHVKVKDDESFLACLPLIEKAATDERNFVKKAVKMALRAVGIRSDTLRKASRELAKRLADSSDGTSKWIGKSVLRDLR